MAELFHTKLLVRADQKIYTLLKKGVTDVVKSNNHSFNRNIYKFSHKERSEIILNLGVSRKRKKILRFFFERHHLKNYMLAW